MKKKRRLKKKYRRALWMILFIGVLFIIGLFIEKYVLQSRPSRLIQEAVDTSARKEPVIGNHPILGVVAPKEVFCDSNMVHMEAAERFGIEPVQTRAAADSLRDLLVLVEEGPLYYIDTLKYSVPYLTFGAKGVLDHIGTAFRDSLYAKGRKPYRPIVTSILRTRDDVELLVKRNRNASENSTHCYATTFDLTYSRFAEPSDTTYPAVLRDATTADLMKVLSEVLRDARNQNLCFVKYEVRQPCFHITARR